MLTHLSIRNFAIIDQLELDFTPGLNVLTGETGAGKSIIMEALGILRGGRVSNEMIRWGEDQARIDAVFDIEPSHRSGAIFATLAESGIELDNHTLILTRELKRNRSNLCRINGCVTTLSLLSRVGAELVDLHTQGEQASLTKPRKQLDLLDGFAGLGELRGALAAKVKQLRQVRSQLEGLRIDEREFTRQIDRLQYELEEIGSTKLEPGEDVVLERELRVLSNAERVIRLADAIYRYIDGGTERQPSARDQLASAYRVLKQLEEVDSRVAEQMKMVEVVLPVIEEVGRSMLAYRDDVELDPRKLAVVEERLRMINHLKRRYGDSIEDILRYAIIAESELKALSTRDDTVKTLQIKESELLSDIALSADEVSSRRLEASSRLGPEIEMLLPEVGMGGVQFRIAVEQVQGEGIRIQGRNYHLKETGIDQVDFRVATAKGEPLKPLRRIASSGEISRVMLAIRSVLSDTDRTPVLVFDEIDSGLGARGGAVIADKLLRLSDQHQVVCVTHLPQIASLADNHVKVKKESAGGRTVAKAHSLGGDERIEELDEMMGSVGAHEGAGSYRNAWEAQRRR